MMKNHHLALSVADVGCSIFVNMLEYKAKNKGRTFVKVDRWFPSSQRRSCCGCVIGKKPLHIRKWTCPKCGETERVRTNFRVCGYMSTLNHLTEGRAQDVNERVKHLNIEE